MKVFKQIITKLLITTFLLFVLLVCFSAYSILAFSKINEIVKTDAAIVLGAATWGTQPSPVFRERINHAIWLYENGYVHKIILTGGKGDGVQYAESEIARTYAIQHNVNKKDILIETQSTITEENLKYAKDIVTKNNIKTVTLVSDPLHMKRAMTMAYHIGLDAYTSPTQSSAYQSLKSKIPFFFRELIFYVGYLLTFHLGLNEMS